MTVKQSAIVGFSWLTSFFGVTSGWHLYMSETVCIAATSDFADLFCPLSKCVMSCQILDYAKIRNEHIFNEKKKKHEHIRKLQQSTHKLICYYVLNAKFSTLQQRRSKDQMSLRTEKEVNDEPRLGRQSTGHTGRWFKKGDDAYTGSSLPRLAMLM